jgi:hypothetical protein
MTTSTIDHADYLTAASVAPAIPDLTPDDVPEADVQRIRRGKEKPEGDPDARQRLASALYRITGWEIFGGDERAYVSRLWAEDWDSPEDSAYDQP